MKLVVTGATGFVGTEIIRLALRHEAITSVVALARKPVQVPDGSGENAGKLQSVIIEDWTAPYSESIKQQLKGADACIWTLAVTPTKSRGMDPDEVTKICYDYTLNGFDNIVAVANSPFRFLYTSGVAAERDQTRILEQMAEQRLMRGRVETAVLNLASKYPSVQAAIAKPGGINGPGYPKTDVLTNVYKQFTDTPWIHVSELSAAMIDQCLNGFAKETLWSKDMTETGAKILSKEEYADFGSGET